MQDRILELEAKLMQQDAVFASEGYTRLPWVERVALCTENYKTRKAHDSACASLLQAMGHS